MQIDPRIIRILSIIVIIIVTFIIIKWLSNLLKKTGQKFELDPTFVQVLQQIIQYSLIVLAITIILDMLGINITGLVLSLGILGVVVGFAARDTIANYISGMFILADKSFRVGDTIEISGKTGKVIKMGFRVTTLITPQNKTIKIPNSLFSKNLHVNYTTQDKRRIDLTIYIPYNLDLPKVISSLEKSASKYKWALETPKPNILIKALLDTGIKASLNVWTLETDKVAQHKSELAEDIKKFLVEDNA